MNHVRRIIFVFIAAAVLTVPLFAQATTGTLVGTVTHDGTPLPGATVTVSSPALQGTRTAYTNENGNYVFPNLPPGDYTVTVEMSGMNTVRRDAKVALSSTSRVDATLQLGSVTEAIVVTAAAPSALETTGTAANFESQTIDELPIDRTIVGTMTIAPGVSTEGPNNQRMISGASSHQNLYLVNGAVVGDNIRNQPEDLFIEDAIKEITILTNGVSAEFGRFTGGVVSTITKSGGNEFSGSLRDSLENDDWTELTPFEEENEIEHSDKLNEVWEATLGGRIIRDRLWFFAAGRMEEDSENFSTLGTNIPYTFGEEEERWEGKLTGNIGQRHNITGAYLDALETESNDWFGDIVDLRSLKTRELPNTLLSVNYNGTITTNFFLEGLFTQREFSFVGDGAQSTDIIEGTLVRDAVSGRRGWSPTFCGVCGDVERDNELWSLKGSYFLATPGLGSHNLVAGYENFSELQVENSYQSGSGFRVFGQFIYQGDQVFVRVDPNNSRHRIQNWPILNLSKTGDATTRSIYLNDRWDLNPRWSFNVGVRYDAHEAIDQSGAKRADDTEISPRLAAIFDPAGNGRHRFNVTYGRYVSKVDQGIADSASNAGSPAFFAWDYAGPAINLGSGPYLTTDQVLRQVFDWFNSVGGVNNTTFQTGADVPGVSTIIPDEGLSSLHMDEYTLGYGLALGSRGFVRGDLIYRQWGDFYVETTNLNTGRVTDQLGRVFDVTIVQNSEDNLEREYRGAQVQASYKLFNRLTVGGNYTWSELKGNVDDETSNNATVTNSSSQDYPEYTSFANFNPVGYLNGDVRHRVNLWGSFDVPFPLGDLNLSLLHRYNTGFPYDAIGFIPTDFIANPGYEDAPTAVGYFFRPRGSLRTEDYHRTDVALNYTLPIRRLVVFVQADLLNALGEESIIDPAELDLDVFTAADEDDLLPFDPRNETPVEGVHYRLSETFGQPVDKEGYQLARTYRFSVGLRF